MTGTDDGSLACLLVEDNPNDARLIKRYLSNASTTFLPEDVTIRHEESLEDGIAALDEGGVDLLLLDLGLPGSTGTESFDRISDRTDAIPVIVLTGLQDERAAVDLLQRGAQDYLNKGSLDEDQLVKSIRYALERQEREEQLRATTEQLEVLNRILRHDIQNDLQVLRGWTEALLERTDDDTTVQTLQRILQTSDHVLELTQNSREYIQFVAAGGDVSLEPVRLDRVLREEVQKAESAYPDAEFHLGDLDPTAVVANEMLSSVFRNLLNNAVQHNDGDAPTVDVAVEHHDDEVHVTVADDGPGVPDGRKADIFGKGEQGLESDGTGIGLYLVHELVTEFGGRVWVEDRPYSPAADGATTDDGGSDVDPAEERATTDEAPAGAVFVVALETTAVGESASPFS